MTDSSNYVSGRAADHYNRFEDDFKVASSMGHNAHRFSIEWSRIEPEEGRFDDREIEHYRKVIGSLRDLGMEPFVTLWHWTLPLWVRDKGGVTSTEFPRFFARFAKRAALEYGEEVRFWMTLNEPTSVISNAYLKGCWPPQRRNPLVALSVARNLARAHRESYAAIKEISPEARVGVGHIMTDFKPHSPFLDLWINGYFPKLCGPETQDYIGLQYYFHKRIGFRKEREERRSDMGWGLHPEGMYRLLKGLACYGKPIYVTENGLADADDQYREWYITETLRNAARAVAEGVDLRGYFHWSLIDNFEWDKGFWPRFGLIGIDYKTLERKPRPSARRYSEICKNNHID